MTGLTELTATCGIPRLAHLSLALIFAEGTEIRKQPSLQGSAECQLVNISGPAGQTVPVPTLGSVLVLGTHQRGSRRPGAARRPAAALCRRPGRKLEPVSPALGASEPPARRLASRSHIDVRMLLPVRALDPFPATVTHAPGSGRVTRSTSERAPELNAQLRPQLPPPPPPSPAREAPSSVSLAVTCKAGE